MLRSRVKRMAAFTSGPRTRICSRLSTRPRDSGLLARMLAALFDQGRGGGTQSDPALEPSEVGGHTLLQRRLALYGKALVVQSVLYWLIYATIWGPTVGFTRSLRHLASWDVFLLTAIYSLYWLVARGKPRSTAVLLAADVVGSLAIGIDNVFLMLGDLGTISGVFENLIGFICILLLRSLIVPSTVKRTLLCGVLMSGPTILGVVLGSHRFDDQSLSWITMLGFSINWSVIALIFSGVASATLYGLRREVRDARRLGQYTLGEKLGEGGMGVVYRASHAMLRRPTAIKLLADGGGGSLARFEQEVHLLAGLNHPNIVTVHDYGRTADGSFYYAMELLEGMDLEKLVAADGPQSAERVIHIVRQVARGLHEAHDVGLVHRDIKPANIFLCRRWGEPDAVKVLDFGLAKSSASPPTELSAHNVVLGTPLYISPESLNGGAPVDARSDIYSLGAVAYFMLTAEPVFLGSTVVQVCLQHLSSTPEAPSERLGRAVPADLEAVVLRCLAKSRADRYPSAAELERALAACAAADEWSSARAQAWWELQADTAPTREVDPAGRTVEIDPTTRQAVLPAAPGLPLARARE
ncbi:MAG: serine/threonine protein kinase [Myxococcales bacterium]|nr:MAG: serine/threonine protein kinase [Myxococcales bacterium]